MAIFISAAQPLDLVPWHEGKPAFNVSEIADSDAPVRQQFPYSYVYYVGAHEGCGCGFQLGEYPDYEDEETPLQRASLAAFASYLAKQLERVKTIDLFACWEGDQSAAPEYYRQLTPAMLQSEVFYFHERESSQITREAA